MWEPVGPLPASIYWRRRGIALVSTVLVIALATWCVIALTTSPAAPGETNPALARRAAQTAPQQASPSPAPTSAGPAVGTVAVQPQALSQVLSQVMSPPGTAGPFVPQARSTTAPVTSRPVTPSPVTPPPVTSPPVTSTAAVEGKPDETPRQAPVPATPVPVPPTGPVPCTNAMIATGAEIARKQYRVGDNPELRLVITNISGQPCVRDLDGVRQEIVVWSGDGARRLWSSNDCINPSTEDLRTLVPGQPVVFSVTWLGRTTTPGCVEPRTMVPAGSYRVLTRLDDVISPPAPFVLTP